MKRSPFTEEQVIGVLKEHEAGAKTADLARKHGCFNRLLSIRATSPSVDAEPLQFLSTR